MPARVAGRGAGEKAPVHLYAASRSAGRVVDARRLFRAYAGSLPVSLGFQKFPAEVRSLPGEYRPPRGELWVAYQQGRVVGCVAVRPLSRTQAELKRLFVRSRARGHGIGVRLVRVAIRFARSAGYRALRLDTIPFMVEAQQLYRRLGFRRIAPYRFNPVRGSSFWELRLSPSASRPTPRGPGRPRRVDRRPRGP